MIRLATGDVKCPEPTKVLETIISKKYQSIEGARTLGYEYGLVQP